MDIKIQQVPGIENIQNIPPIDPKVGQIWLDLTTGQLKVWSGTGWIIEGMSPIS